MALLKVGQVIGGDLQEDLLRIGACGGNLSLLVDFYDRRLLQLRAAEARKRRELRLLRVRRFFSRLGGSSAHVCSRQAREQSWPSGPTDAASPPFSFK